MRVLVPQSGNLHQILWWCFELVANFLSTKFAVPIFAFFLVSPSPVHGWTPPPFSTLHTQAWAWVEMPSSAFACFCFWGRLKRSVRAVQLFGRLAVLETHTLRY